MSMVNNSLERLEGSQASMFFYVLDLLEDVQTNLV